MIDIRKHENELGQMTAAQKKELLVAMLKKKSAASYGNGLTKTEFPQPVLPQPIGEKQSIPEQFYNISCFPEVAAVPKKFMELKQAGIDNPYFRVSDGTVGGVSIIDGREYIDFSGYNYLGFSGDLRVNQAVQAAVERYGTSVAGSRLVSGERLIHRELESELAALLGVDDAIVFVSGHATNVSAIAAVVRSQDLIVHDSLSHNSILQGCMLSGARRIPFPHNDCQALADILNQNRHQYERVLIIIEGVYSVDGDIAPLPEIIELKKQYKALLMIDEAHSLGVIGATGRGIGEYYNVVPAEVDLWMGTLSKTLASCGGYIAGSQELIQYLKYMASGFVYSVGMTPQNTAAALTALRLMKAEPDRVVQLQENFHYFYRLVREKGLNTGESGHSAVIPVIVGDSERCLQLADQLFKHGIIAQPVIYPIVAQEQARLRFFITYTHTKKQIRSTVETIAALYSGIC